MQRIRTSLVAVLAFAIVALVAFARPPAPMPPPVPTPPIDVPIGADLLQATGTFHLSLPSGFFGSGSNAYSGDLAASGAPLKTAGAWELGFTNVIFFRYTATSLSWPASGVGTHAVSVPNLQMNGDSAITVTFMAAAPQNWTVSVALADGLPGLGSYELTRTTTTSGTWTASFPIHPIFTFKRNSTTKVFDPGSVTLTTSSGTWVEIGASSTAGLAVSQFPLGVALTSSSLTSSAIDLSVVPAGVNSGRPGAAYIDPTATVSGSVATIGRQCSIGAHASIAAGAVIGPHATIGAYATIGTNAVVGDYATIGYGATVNSGAMIESRVNVGDYSIIGSNAVVQCDATLGTYCDIGGAAVIWDNCVLQNGASVGASAILNPRVQVGANALIASAVHVAPDATIAASATVTNDTVMLLLSGGGTSIEDGSGAGNWVSAGIVFGALAWDGTPGMGGPPVNGHPTWPGLPPDGGWGTLLDDIGSDCACSDLGGSGPGYVFREYDCIGFAEALRAKLAAITVDDAPKYQTTFTCYNEFNPAYLICWHVGTPMYLEGHCLTDIHWPDGTTTWIDAMFPDDEGVHLDNEEMDDNDDSEITYTDGYCGAWPTDGNMNIRVYESRAAAEAAGEPVPAQ